MGEWVGGFWWVDLGWFGWGGGVDRGLEGWRGGEGEARKKTLKG